jgi:hypothetical protein
MGIIGVPTMLMSGQRLKIFYFIMVEYESVVLTAEF